MREENIPKTMTHGMRHHVLAVCLVLLATQTPVQSQITGCEQNSDPTDCQYYCSAVNYTAHGCNLSNTWLMSNVRTMRYMFAGTTENIPDISVWDMTGEVEDVTGLFYQAINFNQDISPRDVQYITKMDYMFWEAPLFNGDISEWDVSRVIDMNSMFADAPLFNSDISKWGLSKVTVMATMFQGTASFNGDISKWDVSSVTDMASMFRDARSFNSDISYCALMSLRNMMKLMWMS